MITKYNKWLLNTANGHKVYQMVLKDMKKFNSKAFQNIPKNGGFGLKMNHLATLVRNQKKPDPHPHSICDIKRNRPRRCGGRIISACGGLRFNYREVMTSNPAKAYVG
jgi:hypothetical protein